MISPVIIIVLFVPLVVLNVHRGDAFGAACFAFVVGLQTSILMYRWFDRKAKEGREHSTRD